MNMAIWCQDINMLLKVWALLLTFGPSFSTERNCFCLNTEEPCVVRSHHVVWQNTKIDWRNGVCSCFFQTTTKHQNRVFSDLGIPNRGFVRAETTHNLGILGWRWAAESWESINLGSAQRLSTNGSALYNQHHLPRFVNHHLKFSYINIILTMLVWITYWH